MERPGRKGRESADGRDKPRPDEPRDRKRERAAGAHGGRMSTAKWVYDFEEGDRTQKFLLGGKGANLAEMTNLGLPVPPGFTITTEACNAYRENQRQFPEGLLDQV